MCHNLLDLLHQSRHKAFFPPKQFKISISAASDNAFPKRHIPHSKKKKLPEKFAGKKIILYLCKRYTVESSWGISSVG